jgi:hypothetical protein
MPDVSSAMDGTMGMIMEVQLLQHVMVPSRTTAAVLQLVAQSAGTYVKWYAATRRELDARRLMSDEWGCVAAKLLQLTSRDLVRLGGWLEQRLQHGPQRELLRQLGRVVRLLLLLALRLARWLVAANHAGVAPALGSTLLNMACDLAWLHHLLQQAGPRAAVAAAAVAREWEPLLGALVTQLGKLPLGAGVLVRLQRSYGPGSEPLWSRGAQLVFRSPVHIEKSLILSLRPIADELVRGGSSSTLLGVLLARATDVIDVLEASHHRPGRDLLAQLACLKTALCSPTLLLAEYSPQALRAAVTAVMQECGRVDAAGDLARGMFLHWAACAEHEQWTRPVTGMSLHHRTCQLVQGSISSTSSSGSSSEQQRIYTIAVDEYLCRLAAGRGGAGRLAGQCLGCWNSGCIRMPTPRTSLCAHCGIARYCSAACQAEAWPCHRFACARMQARRRQPRV